MKSNQHWPNRDCVKLLGKFLRNLFFSEYFECFTLKFHSTFLQRIYNRRVEYDVRPDKYLNKNKLKINETFQSFFWKYLENQFSCNCASTQTNPPTKKRRCFSTNHIDASHFESVQFVLWIPRDNHPSPLRSVFRKNIEKENFFIFFNFLNVKKNLQRKTKIVKSEKHFFLNSFFATCFWCCYSEIFSSFKFRLTGWYCSKPDVISLSSFFRCVNEITIYERVFSSLYEWLSGANAKTTLESLRI